MYNETALNATLFEVNFTPCRLHVKSVGHHVVCNIRDLDNSLTDISGLTTYRQQERRHRVAF